VLTKPALQKMQARIKKIIHPRKDHLRYYFLCAACAGRVQTTAAGELTTLEAVIVA
jgi:CRISPR/Cas system-associated endoribonuclease Cas2